MTAGDVMYTLNYKLFHRLTKCIKIKSNLKRYTYYAQNYGPRCTGLLHISVMSSNELCSTHRTPWILTDYTARGLTRKGFYWGNERLLSKQPVPSQTWIYPITFSCIASFSTLSIHFPETVGRGVVKHKDLLQTSACPDFNKGCPMIGSQIFWAISCLFSVNNTVKLLNVIGKVRKR